MPQDPVMVYSVEDGSPLRMHSVDADEAVRLGDYTRTAPSGKELTPQDLAVANAAMRGPGGTVHPELMSPEDRAAYRQKANEEAEKLAEATGNPSLAPVRASTAGASAAAAPRASSSATGASSTARTAEAHRESGPSRSSS